jgi:hypothetical protein
MKITRIEDVYTVPKTEEEWKLFPVRVRSDREICISSNSRCMTVRLGHCSSLGMTEIPVDRFLDLLNDMIAPWRLDEAGFRRNDSTGLEYFNIEISKVDLSWSAKYGVAITKGVEDIWLTITTFTELLQQMKFLGWKNEEQ